MTRRRGFTLLEILIASSMFVVVLLMTMSVISWASSYNSKLAEVRKTTLAGRKIIEMISSDIRQANGSTNIVGIGDSFESGEVVILKNIGEKNIEGKLEATNSFDSYEIKDFYSAPSAPENDYGMTNVLIIINKSDKKIIFYRGLEAKKSDLEYYKDVIRYEIAYAELIDLSSADNRFKINQSQIINEKGTDITLLFTGFTPRYNNIERKYQPYVTIKLTAETENYSALPAQFKSKINIQTSVETRSYN